MSKPGQWRDVWYDGYLATVEVPRLSAQARRRLRTRNHGFVHNGHLYAYTDYPFAAVFGISWKYVEICSYDGNKYCVVRLPIGTYASVKVGYLHRFPGGPYVADVSTCGQQEVQVSTARRRDSGMHNLTREEDGVTHVRVAHPQRLDGVIVMVYPVIDTDFNPLAPPPHPNWWEDKELPHE